jgi:phosphatidylinositol alpha-1,6-mannosyltransferase
MGYRRKRIDLLRSGIDTDSFRPGAKDPDLMASLGLKPEDRVAVFMGTMYGFSGLDYVLSHFDRVLARVPGARLLLIGGGEELERFKQLSRSSGLEDHVIFTGMRPVAELPRLINCADVAFNSFRRSRTTNEILPEKMQRYMACGKGVLCTPLDAVVEMLEGPSNGVVFAEEGIRFVDSMADLLADPQRTAALGKAALEYVRREHDWDRAVDHLELILRRLTGNVAVHETI